MALPRWLLLVLTSSFGWGLEKHMLELKFFICHCSKLPILISTLLLINSNTTGTVITYGQRLRQGTVSGLHQNTMKQAVMVAAVTTAIVVPIAIILSDLKKIRFFQ